MAEAQGRVGAAQAAGQDGNAPGSGARVQGHVGREEEGRRQQEDGAVQQCKRRQRHPWWHTAAAGAALGEMQAAGA
jgi:hypothetical protein